MAAFQIFPSLLSANLSKLADEADLAIASGADGLHIDVMDNHYVPNLTFGPWICKTLRENGCQAFLDTHLMAEPVDELIAAFAKAGTNAISFHPEASRHTDRSIQLIIDHGCQAGLALNPATPLDVLDYVIEKLDFVLLMSVNPGFGGQIFIPSMLRKISELQHYLQQRNPLTKLAIDGGINFQNLTAIAELGVDTFIMGSAIFNNHGAANNLQQAKKLLQEL